MRGFIIFCLISLTVAEPPVGDGYPSSRSSHDHHHHDHGSSFGSQGYPGSFASRSAVSQEYGAPNTRSGLSSEYGVPNARSGISTDYGAPNARSGLSTEYGAPGQRSLSQEYGTPGFRSSGQDFSSFSQAPSEEYGAPNARSLDEDLGISTFVADSQDFSPRNSPSNSYLPAVRSSLSDTYGAPDFRSAPSSEYGIPSQRSFGQFSSRTPSQQYGAPGFRSGFLSQASGRSGYPKTSVPASVVTRSFGSSKSPSQSYGAPESRSLSTQYGAPDVGSIDSYSQGFGAGRSLSDSYSAPNARGLSQQYAASSARSGNLKTSALASSYSAARSSPSQQYGAPSARMVSSSYGVPEQQSALSGQGYSYARNALDELISQEPANYDFGYKVNDFESGSDFGHKESRQDNRAEGSYFVVLPDGTKQVVEYEADERGFKPRISVEPANPAGRHGGYDDNAANIDNNGPY